MEYYKQNYEKYWSSKESLDNFFTYERNKALPYFFQTQKTPSLVKILDLGGGDGCVSEFMRNLGYEVILLDISKNALLKAKNLRGLDRILLANVEKLPFKNENFDIVFWGDNIEHLLYPKNVLGEINRILKKNGEVVISFPNMAYWRHRLHYARRGMVPRTEGTINEPWEWEHIRFFNHNVINALLNVCGFKLEKQIGVSQRKYEDKLAKKLDLFASILIIKAYKK